MISEDHADAERMTRAEELNDRARRIADAASYEIWGGTCGWQSGDLEAFLRLLHERLREDGGFPVRLQIDQGETLVAEALCRVIASAGRFQTCIEAAAAINNARRLAEEIRHETARFNSSGQSEISREPSDDS